MNDPYFKELGEELKKSVAAKDHPFRYFTLGTVGMDRMARLRTVVLRKVSDELVFSFYTDRRSKKIVHIKENNKVSMLFYHPGRQLQLKVEGLALLNRDPDVNNPLWKDIAPDARKEYTAFMPPGSTLQGPEHIEYLSDEHYFCLVEVHPFKIEYLKLSQPHHLRIRYSRKEEDWKREYLVP